VAAPEKSQSGYVGPVLSLLQWILPATVSVLCLYASCLSFGYQFDTKYIGLATVVAALTLVLFRPMAEEAANIATTRASFAVSILGRWLVLLGVLLVLGYAIKLASYYSRRAILTWASLTPVVLALCAVLLREMMLHSASSSANCRRAIIAGFNETSLKLAGRFRIHAHAGVSILGFFDDRNAERLGSEMDIPLLGRLGDLPAFLEGSHIDIVFIALPIRHVQRVLELVDRLRDTTVSIFYVPDILVFDLIQARTSDVGGIPVIAMCETPFYGHRNLIKRLTDVVISLAIVPIVLPLMLIIALLVFVSSRGPVIFKQRRYGLDGAEIVVYKFRTMTVVEDGSSVTQATKDDKRVTGIGKFLRRYSLDELPQIINVLQGRMSLVGPRPHAVAHNEQYRKLIKGYMVRHKVPPGITGLAQVKGCRGETAELSQMQARLDFDLEYLRRWSPMLDVEILLLTVLQLVRSRNVY